MCVDLFHSERGAVRTHVQFQDFTYFDLVKKEAILLELTAVKIKSIDNFERMAIIYLQ